MSGSEYYDEVWLRVKVVGDATGEEVRSISEVAFPEGIGAADVRNALEHLRESLNLRDGYVQTESRTTFEWGASAAILQSVFETGIDVASAAVWAAAGWAVGRAKGRVASSLDAPDPLTVDDARHSVSQAIVRTWGTDPKTLEPAGEEIKLSEGTIRVAFIDAAGYVYEGEAGRNKHLLQTIRVSRRRNDALNGL